MLDILIGAEWHVSPDATIDTRVILQYEGRDITEDNLVKVREEAHWSYGAQATLRVHLGGGFSLVVGGTAFTVQDHEANDVTMLDQEDTFLYQLQLGLHFYFGAK